MGLELKTSQGVQPPLQVNLWFAGMEKDPWNSSTHTKIKNQKKKTNPITMKPTCSALPSAKQIDIFLVDGGRGNLETKLFGENM